MANGLGTPGRPSNLIRQLADWAPTTIAGVVRRTLPAHVDERGYLRELWRSSWPANGAARRMAQANVSHSAPGVLRGLHFHRRQADLWVVLNGRAHVAVVDLRPLLDGANEPPRSITAELGPGEAILIPEGVAHGFWALGPLDLLYLVTNEYDGSDELGFAWDDPVANVAWPGREPLLSPRDASSPSLEEALRAIR